MFGNACRAKYTLNSRGTLVDPSKQKCVDVKIDQRREGESLVKIGNGDETGRVHVGDPYLVCALLPRRKGSAIVV